MTIRDSNVNRLVLPLFLLALLVSGCRTYGGYGTEDAMVEEIAQANRLFAEDLERARADLRRIEGAAGEQVALAPFAEDFRALVLGHEALLAVHQAWAEEAAGSGYREVSRLYGAINTEQTMVRQKYQHALQDVYQPGDSLMTLAGNVLPEGRYFFVPPYYERLTTEQQYLTVSDLLGAVARMPTAPLPDEVPAQDAAAGSGAGPGELPIDSVATPQQ